MASPDLVTASAEQNRLAMKTAAVAAAPWTLGAIGSLGL